MSYEVEVATGHDSKSIDLPRKVTYTGSVGEQETIVLALLMRRDLTTPSEEIEGQISSLNFAISGFPN